LEYKKQARGLLFIFVYEIIKRRGGLTKATNCKFQNSKFSFKMNNSDTTGASTGTKTTKTEQMFKNAEKGQILLAGNDRHEIIDVGSTNIGRTISINLKGKKTNLYFKEEHQSLQRFVPDEGWDTLPGSTNFKIVSA